MSQMSIKMCQAHSRVFLGCFKHLILVHWSIGQSIKLPVLSLILSNVLQISANWARLSNLAVEMNSSLLSALAVQGTARSIYQYGLYLETRSHWIQAGIEPWTF